MSIITRTGDEGETGLWSGERIPKDDSRVEAYGTIDELSAALGAARHSCMVDSVIYAIDMLQKDLFRAGGELASIMVPFDRPITSMDGETLAQLTAEIESRIPLRGFVIPGMTQGSAALDIARTVARRAERRIVALSRSASVSRNLLIYMNRLSDFIFMLAREEETAAGKLRYL